jgi:predicted permease
MRKIWQALWNRQRFETDLAEEMRFHLEARAAELERTGHSKAEAARLARIEFGAVEHHKEECRQARCLRWFDEIRLDLLYAFRALNANRAFASIAIATLALGIGANACIFTLLNAVLLKTLPVERPEELQAVYWALPRDHRAYAQDMSGSSTREGNLRVADMFAYPHFARLRSDLAPRADLFAHGGYGRLNVIVNGQAQLVRGAATSWNYFRGLQVSAYLGRTFLPEDEEPNAPASAVLLSYNFWSRAFGADKSILGQPLTIGDGKAVVVGILPPYFHGVNPGESVDLVIPLVFYAQIRIDGEKRLTDVRSWWVNMMARVQPDASVPQLRSEIETRLIAILRANPVREPYDAPKIRLVDASRGLHWLRTEFEKPLRLVMLVALLILLIAAVNVSGLLLARSEARATETAARLALGAGRFRIARQHLTESLLLAILGLAGGAVIARLLGGVLPSLLSRRGEIPVLDLAPDATFMAITAVATIMIALLVGIYPAWKGSQLDLTAALKRTHGARTGRLPMGRVLVAAQVGLSLVLLIAAAMFLRTVSNLRSLRLGFTPDHLLVFRADPPLAGYTNPRLTSYYDQALRKLSMIPGVRSVSLSQHGLVRGDASSTDFYHRDSSGQLKALGETYVHQVAPRYFETTGIPLLMGRDVRSTDTANSQRVALVNEKLARSLCPDGRSPIGLPIFTGEKYDQRVEIIGVVGDAKYDAIRREAPLTVYAPFAQREVRNGTFYVRTGGEPLAIAATVRRVMADVDSRVPIWDLRTQEEQISLAIERERILAKLLAGFGAVGLVLAAIGIYGILSYSVARRTSEMGIRLALGAAPAAVQRMILRESLLPVFVGVAAGLGGACWFTRLLEAFVFGVKPMDTWSVLSGVAVLVASAIIAAWIPAYRASRLAPLTALRYE